jgi:hypothetical protein
MIQEAQKGKPISVRTAFEIGKSIFGSHWSTQGITPLVVKTCVSKLFMVPIMTWIFEHGDRTGL